MSNEDPRDPDPRPPLAHCDSCAFFRWRQPGGKYAEPIGEPECRKGHELKFYPPRDYDEAIRGEYGFIRRCDDFEPASCTGPEPIAGA